MESATSQNAVDFPSAALVQKKPSFEQPINVYSENEVLKTLGEYLEAICSTHPLRLDTTYGDYFIGLSSCASLVAIYACLRLKFPEDSSLLILCLIVHYCCIIVWTCIDYFILKGASFIFWSPENIRYRVDLSLDRVSGHVTFSLQPFQSSLMYTSRKKHTCSIGHYFTEDGYFDKMNLYHDFLSLFRTCPLQKPSQKQQQQPSQHFDKISRRKNIKKS